MLFASSIKENITYGKDGATTEEIRAAAELANAAKFIDKLPQVLIFNQFSYTVGLFVHIHCQKNCQFTSIF